ncbi:MAG: NAD-dependent epimerase/dehydratase family protein [Candidatus Glassbacteria bacterium]|nr:NAD-dependent epimerase/dehydratase family protein [Candidatus Glassbacteria bacterium]
MRILVTGGAGFIGSHVVEHFHAGHEVVVVDNLRTGYRSNLDGLNHQFHEVTITDRERLFPLFEGVDRVFHLAAMISVPESLGKPAECVEINTQGTLNVLEAAREHGVERVVFTSSAAVYGDNPVVPKREDMLPEPKSPYAVTKLDGEYYLKIFEDEWGVGAGPLRFFNVFGPRQDPRSQYAAAIPIFIHRALRGEDITVYGDGTQVRDFVYVKDVVSACVLASEKGGPVCNVARGEHITINDIARQIIDLTGSSSKLIHAGPRSGDIHTSYADISRLKSLGYRPEPDQRECLLATIRFFEGCQG